MKSKLKSPADTKTDYTKYYKVGFWIMVWGMVVLIKAKMIWGG